jgi:type I restriction enzyme S subunit
MAAVATGTTNSHVRLHPRETLLWPVDLPPSAEQSRIAEILDTVDAAIRETEVVVAKLRQVKAGLLRDLLTRGPDVHGHLRDPARHPDQFKESAFGRIPREWSPRRLTEAATFQNGRAFPSSDYGDIGMPLLRPGNLGFDGDLVWTPSNTIRLPFKWTALAKDYIVTGEELVMNLTAQSLEDQFLGRVRFTSARTFCLLNQRIARFKPKGTHLPFLFWMLKSEHFRSQIDRVPHGTKVQHIYNEDLERTVLPVPDRLSEQERIAEVLFEHSETIQAREAELSKLHSLKRGLAHDLLTGRVRVRI